MIIKKEEKKTWTISLISKVLRNFFNIEKRIEPRKYKKVVII